MTIDYRGKPSAIYLPCPYCGAQAKKPCKTKTGGDEYAGTWYFHDARYVMRMGFVLGYELAVQTAAENVSAMEVPVTGAARTLTKAVEAV